MAALASFLNMGLSKVKLVVFAVALTAIALVFALLNDFGAVSFSRGALLEDGADRVKKYSELKATDVIVRVDDRELTAGDFAAHAKLREWILTRVFKRNANREKPEKVLEQFAQSFIQRFVFISLWDMAAIHANYDDADGLDRLEDMFCKRSGLSSEQKLYQTVSVACGMSEKKLRQWMRAETRASSYQNYCATNGLSVTPADIANYTNNLSDVCRVCALSNEVMTTALTQALKDLKRNVDFGRVQTNFLLATHSDFPIRWGVFSYDDLTECGESGKILAAWAFSAPIGSTSSSFYELDDSRAIIRIADRSSRKSVFESMDNDALQEDTVVLDRLAVKVWDAPTIPSAEEAEKLLREAKINEAKRNLTVELLKKAKVEYPQGTELW